MEASNGSNSSRSLNSTGEKGVTSGQKNQQGAKVMDSNKAESLVHQTGADGVQPQKDTENEIDTAQESEHSSIFWCIFSCCLPQPSRSADYIATSPYIGSGKSADAPLLDAKIPSDASKKTLVLDLDETLVHSTFQAVPGVDIVLPIEIDGVVYRVYVRKRPGADRFLQKMAEIYEVVVYTASLQKYADPLLDLLDPNRLIRARLFRKHCTFRRGAYLKDLSRLGRALPNVLILDNSPLSFSMQPKNGLPCTSYIDDPSDRELDDLIPYLEDLAQVEDVTKHTHKWKTRFREHYKNKAKKVARSL